MKNTKSLYAFAYPELMVNQIVRKGTIRVKIGETQVEVDERIDNQTRGSGVCEEPTKIWEVSLNKSKVESDHQLHKMLVENNIARRVGRNDKKSTEWFDFIAPSFLVNIAKDDNISDEDIVEAAKAHMKGVLNRALELIEKELTPQPVMVYNEPQVKSYYAKELLKHRDWYHNTIDPMDMKYKQFEGKKKFKKVNGEKVIEQPYIMNFDLMVNMLDKAELCRHIQPKILVIEAIEIVCVLLKMGYNESRIEFASVSEDKRRDIEQHGVATYPLNIMLKRYKNKELKMKFAACLQNPPYESGMHVDFVNMGVAVADRVVAVHPSTPIINMKPTSRTERDVELIGNLNKHDSSVELIDGNQLFTAGFLAPLSVTTINKNIKGGKVKVSGYYDAELDANDINQIGSWANKFYSMISCKNKMVDNVRRGNYYVKIGQVRGHAPKSGERFNSDFFTMVPRDTSVYTERLGKSGWSEFGFDTEFEAENFLGFVKTKFVRFMMSLYKINGNMHRGELNLIPWMDFTQEWNDEKLFAHFNVSVEDQQRIEDFIPDYY